MSDGKNREGNWKLKGISHGVLSDGKDREGNWKLTASRLKVPPFGPKEAADMKIHEPGGRNLQDLWEFIRRQHRTREEKRRRARGQEACQSWDLRRRHGAPGLRSGERGGPAAAAAAARVRGEEGEVLSWLGRPLLVPSYSPCYDDVVRPSTETWAPHHGPTSR